jgi:hypothetical protein
MAPTLGFYRSPAFLISLLLAIGVQAYCVLHLHTDPPIRSDGWGYYLHLPAAFVYGDLHLSFLKTGDLPPDLARHRFASGNWQGLSPTETGYRDKYALGPAVLQLPFFLGALVYAKWTLPSVSGFEIPFQVANVLSAAFYFALGTWLAYQTARLRYARLPSAAAIAFAVFATNLLFYAAFDGSFSHIYGFCIIAGLVYLTIRTQEAGAAPGPLAFALFGFLMGLAVMVRPTNAVAALLYLVFVRRAKFSQLAIGTLLGIVASVCAAAPQMLLWLFTTGSLIYWSYVGEGFKFLTPGVLAYLAAPPKGIFFWHPAYLIMIVSLAAQLPARLLETAVLLAIVALNIYLGAAWGDNTFGDSFGCRQIVEMIPLLLPSTAAAAAWATKATPRRAVAITLAIALAAANTLLFYGYVKSAFPHNKATLADVRAFWSHPFGR